MLLFISIEWSIHKYIKKNQTLEIQQLETTKYKQQRFILLGKSLQTVTMHAHKSHALLLTKKVQMAMAQRHLHSLWT
jgi:hypothetical protein